SGEYTTKATGTYYRSEERRVGKENEAGSTACGDEKESSLVNPGKPSITTSATTPVTVGEKIHDTATISGLVEPTGKGTITFKLYSDKECKTKVFSSASAGISANGKVSSGEYTTKATGTYY